MIQKKKKKKKKKPNLSLGKQPLQIANSCLNPTDSDSLVIPQPTSCHSHTFSIVRHHDLDMLMTSFKGNSSSINIFCLSLLLRRTSGKILLCQPNITHAESNLVQPHIPLMHACLIVYDSSQFASTLDQLNK